MDILECRVSNSADPWADYPIAVEPPEFAAADYGGNPLLAYYAFGKRYWYGSDFSILVHVLGAQDGESVTRVVPLREYSRFLQERKRGLFSGILGYSRGPKLEKSSAGKPRKAPEARASAKSGAEAALTGRVSEQRKPELASAPWVLAVTAGAEAAVVEIFSDAAPIVGSTTNPVATVADGAETASIAASEIPAVTMAAEAGESFAEAVSRVALPAATADIPPNPMAKEIPPGVRRRKKPGLADASSKPGNEAWTPADIASSMEEIPTEAPAVPLTEAFSGATAETKTDGVPEAPADVTEKEEKLLERKRKPRKKTAESGTPEAKPDSGKSKPRKPQTKRAADPFYDPTLHEFVRDRGDTPAAVFDMLVHIAIQQRDRVKRPIPDAKIYMTTWCMPEADILRVLLDPAHGAGTVDDTGNFSLSIANLNKHKVRILAQLVLAQG